MQMALPPPFELVERIILEIRSRPWVALSNGGCGVLAHALIGRTLELAGYDEGYRGARSFGLAFAHRVVSAMAMSPAQQRVPTPQILVDTVEAVKADLALLSVLCTTWRSTTEGIEICSVGANSVLLFEEGEAIREVISRHTYNELWRLQGSAQRSLVMGEIPLCLLGANCSVEDVRVALVPLLPTRTIAVIQKRQLAEALMEHSVSREDLPSFIEAWKPQGKRIRTSVLISL
jgi:hypothetical protein